MYDYEKLVLKPGGDVDIKIAVNQIPVFQQRQLAEFALDLTREVFSRPGEEIRYREWLQKRQEGEKK